MLTRLLFSPIMHCSMLFFAAPDPGALSPAPPPPAPAAPTTEQKVLDSMYEVVTIGGNIAARFGGGNIATALQTVPTLIPVFASVFDTIKALFAHHKATQA